MEIVQRGLQYKVLVRFDLDFPVDTGCQGDLSCNHVYVYLTPYWLDHFHRGLDGLSRNMLPGLKKIFRPYAHDNLLLGIPLGQCGLFRGKVYPEAIRLEGQEFA